ncbi:MAG: S8 family serine peptidase [Calditrichaeota bacterium]|nr:S8 family serine peptidase [Calditrichota bacterium]
MKRQLGIAGVAGLIWVLAGFTNVLGQGVQTELYRAPSSPKWSAKFADRLQKAAADEKLKVWVFFTDKGLNDERAVQQVLSQPQRFLTERALRRRAKLGRAQLVNFADLPIYGPYVHEVLATGARLRARSRWLNAVSIWATPRQVLEIADKPFVARLRLVAGGRRPKPRKELQKAGQSAAPLGIDASPYALDYGASRDQLEQISVPQLHELGYTGAGVLVAMLDVGYYKDHETFSHLKVVAERDFVMKDDDTQRDPNNPNDYSDSHGTLTWSTLAGYTPGKLIGPAYRADFLLAKTEDTRSETPVEEDYWAAAAEWADSLGADVISSSLGYYDWYQFKDMDGNTAVSTIAADWAAKQGIAVAVAAGNWNLDPNWGHIDAPADGDSVITVGAVTLAGTIADFSSRGPTYDGRIKPEVCALGVHTRCATRGGPSTYGYASGTSLATPLVGGVCALLLEAHPDWTGWDVRQALIRTASQADHPDNTYGWGIVNAFAASGLQAAVPALKQVSLEEPAETANNVVDPGETLRLNFTIENIGNVEGAGQAVLRSADPYVTVTDSTVRLAQILPGRTAQIVGAFEFVASDSLPEGHVSHLVLVLELGGRRFERDLELPGAGGYAVSGSVWDFGLNQAAAGAVVVARPVDKPLSAARKFSADAFGNFSAVLPAGEYAFQAWKTGAMPFHAVKSLVPQSDPGTLRLSLFRPALGVLQVGTTVSGTAATAQLDLRNTGSGPLFVAVLPAPVDGGATSGGLWGEPGSAVLWRDLDEQAPLDLSELDATWDSSFVTFDLVHWRKPGNPGDLAWWIYLDLDDSLTTGDSLGADLILEVREEPARVTGYTVTKGQRRVLPNLNANVTSEPGKVHIQVPTSVLQGVAPWVPVRVEAQQRTAEGVFETFDVLPDSSLWRAVLPTFHPRGLQVSQPLATLASGQSEKVQIRVANLEDLPSLRVGFASWDPVMPWKVVTVDLKTSVENSAGQPGVPQQWQLSTAFPNPFNGATQFELAVPERAEVTVQIVDLRGRVVRTLLDGVVSPGVHRLRWDGRADDGTLACSGVYLVRARAGQRVLAVRKLLYLR